MKIFLPFLLSPLLSAEIVDVTLTLSAANSSQNSLDLSLNVPILGGSSDTSEVSGTILARLDIDPDTGTISTLELLSGNLTGTPVSFSRSVFLVGSYNLTTSVIQGTVDTLSPPAPVIGGQSAAELHEFTINSGTLTGSATVLGSTTAVDEDFSQTPVSGTGVAGDFVTISSTANAGGSTPTMAVYDLELTYPIEISEEVDVGVIVTFDAEGDFHATGQVSLAVEPPNPYLTWAEANGITNAVFTDNDFSNQLPNGLLWALGYDGSDSPEVLCAVANGSGTFTLNLPASGSAAEVVVQSSTDLSDPNSWSTLATIPAGTTAAQGPFGGGAGPEFLRLLAEDPAE